jgi:16S rRNA (guanine527-N7)-methyltransferase
MLTPAQKQRLTAAAKSYGAELTGDQLAQFDRMTELLIEWNAKFNLTAIKLPEDIVDKHYIDSIAANPLIGPADVVLDIGTGAGFPGLPLKIVGPGRKVVMIDGTGKKIKYVQTVIADLKLENTSALHQRAEDPGFQFGFGQLANVVTARAVAPADELVALGKPFLKPGGKLLLFKGVDEAEAVKGKTWAGFLPTKVTYYSLPAGDKRALLELVNRK